jgi:uncharacterized membrane protein YqhA
MLHFISTLRFVMLLASLGSGIGALLMFWAGALNLIGGIRALYPGSDSTKPITVAVMHATDSFLFGTVLFFFAYAIAFGFVLRLPDESRRWLPKWIHVENLGELKRSLVEVVLVYLIVDFATDLATAEDHISWEALVKPVSILLIAGALRVLGNSHAEIESSARAEDRSGISPG